MEEPRAVPPPRPRWVWAVIVVVGAGLATALLAHLFLGNPMKSFHGAGIPSPSASVGQP